MYLLDRAFWAEALAAAAATPAATTAALASPGVGCLGPELVSEEGLRRPESLSLSSTFSRSNTELGPGGRRTGEEDRAGRRTGQETGQKIGFRDKKTSPLIQRRYS